MSAGDDKKDPKKGSKEDNEDDWLAAIDEWDSGLDGIIDEPPKVEASDVTVKTPAPQAPAAKAPVFYRPPTQPVAPVVRERVAPPPEPEEPEEPEDPDRTRVTGVSPLDLGRLLRGKGGATPATFQDQVTKKVAPGTVVPDAARRPELTPPPVRPTRGPTGAPPTRTPSPPSKPLAPPGATRPAGGIPRPTAPPPRPVTGVTGARAPVAPVSKVVPPPAAPAKTASDLLSFDEPDSSSLFGTPTTAPAPDTLETAFDKDPTTAVRPATLGPAASFVDEPTIDPGTIEPPSFEDEPSVQPLDQAAMDELQSMLGDAPGSLDDALPADWRERTVQEPRRTADAFDEEEVIVEAGAVPESQQRSRQEVPFDALPDRPNEYWAARVAILEAQVPAAVDGPAAARLLCEMARILEQRLAATERASRAYSDAYARDPKAFAPIAGLIRMAEDANRWDEVDQYLDVGLELPLAVDERVALLLYKAELALSVRRNLERAQDALEAARQLAPEEPQVALGLAEVAFGEGREDEIAQRLAPVPDTTGPVGAALALVAAAAHERSGDAGKALEAYRRALAHEPSLTGTLLAVERTALAAGDPAAAREAATLFATALGQAPEAAAFQYRVARLTHLETGAAARAVESLGALLPTVPRLYALMMAAAQAGSVDVLVQSGNALAARSEGPDRAAAYVTIASALAASDRPADAADYLARASVAAPSFGPAIYAEEEMLRSSGHLQRAAERHAMFGEEVEAAALFEQKGMSADAIAILERAQPSVAARALVEALEVDRGGWPKVLLRRADAISREGAAMSDVVGRLFALSDCQLGRLGDAEGAAATVARIRELAPDDPSTASTGLAAEDEVEAAHEEASRLTDDTRAADALVREAWALEAAQNPGEAALVYEAALARVPAHALAAAGLTRLRWAAPDPEGAAALARSLVAVEPGRSTHLRVLAARAVADVDPAASIGELTTAMEQDREPALSDLALVLSAPGTARAELLEQVCQGLDGPALVRALVRAAEAWEDLGDDARAADLYLRAETLAPGDPGITAALENALAAAGHLQALSERCLQALKSEDPDTRWLAYGRLQVVDGVLRGDEASATLALEGQLELRPDHLPTLRALERRALATGQSESIATAYSRLAQALTGTPDAAAYCRHAARMADLVPDAPPFGSVELAVIAAETGTDAWALRYLEASARADQQDAALAAVASRQAAAATLPLEKAAYSSREGDALLQMGDLAAALAAYQAAAAAMPDYLAALRGVAHTASELALEDVAAAAYEAAAAASIVPAHIAEDAYLAGRRYQDILKDGARALACLNRVLDADPSYLDAYDRVAELLGEQGRHADAAAACERRIAAGGPPAMLAALWGTLGEERLALGDRVGCKQALRESCQLDPQRPDALRRLGELLLQDGEFPEAADALAQLTKLTGDKGELRQLFFQLGEVYDEKLPDAKRAEQNYRRVLQLDEGDLPTLERLSALHIRQGDWAQAREVTVKLIQLVREPRRRRELRVALSRVFEVGFRDARSAEAQLEEARREAPVDVDAIGALQDFYRRQGGGPALAIHLDRAAADVRRLLAVTPFNETAHHTLFQTLTWRGNREGARAVAEVLVMLGKARPEERAAYGAPAGPNPKGADPALDEVLAPPAVIPALREMLRLLSETLIKAYPVEVKAFGVGKQDRVPSKGHPMREIAQKMARWFGLSELEVYVSQRDPSIAVVLPGGTPSLILGRDLLAATDEGERVFLTARALKLVQANLAQLLLIPSNELGLVLAAIVKQFDPSYAPAGLDPAALEERTTRLGKLIPRKVKEPLMAFALECAGARALEPVVVQSAALELGDRTGLLVCGSLASGLGALRKVGGDRTQVGSLEELQARTQPHAAAMRLLSFAVSDPYFQLKKSANQG